MSHVEAHPFPEGTGDCVSRVNPTVGVEDVLGNVFGVYAVNGVANILPSRDNQAEGQQADNGESVVQPEYGRIDVHVADFDQGLEASEYVDHPSTGRIFFLNWQAAYVVVISVFLWQCDGVFKGGSGIDVECYNNQRSPLPSMLIFF